MKKFYVLLLLAIGLAVRADADRIVEVSPEHQIIMRGLQNKGLTAAAVMPKNKRNTRNILAWRPHRPTPVAELRDRFTYNGKTGSVKYQKIQVELLEEFKIDRNAAVKFALPLAKGALFATGNIRLLDPQGAEIPMQSAVTGVWNDDSLRFVLLQFNIPMKAKEKKFVTVEFGTSVKRTPVAKGIEITDKGDKISVNTGKLAAVIDKKNFKLIENITVNGSKTGSFGNGMVLVDEQGRAGFSGLGKVKRVVIENSGKLFAVIRVDGTYSGTSGMSYCCRLYFKKDSSEVGVEWSHVNTSLANEFADVTALYLDYTPLKPGKSNLPRELQADETNVIIAGGKSKKRRSHGTVRAGNVICGVRDFWQRFPKAISIDSGKLRVELLPFLDKNYGETLPWYHRYAFVEGKHRSKWGMSFTEMLSFEFDAKSVSTVRAELNMPVIAVVPAAYLGTTGSVPGIGGINNKIFTYWDERIKEAWDDSVRRRKKQREYGYFNYGDAFGERLVNWNNNEYDFGATMFLAFLRTGNRDYYRWAQITARHLADVDLCHAYPDKAYIGCNLQHSIGHTGLSSAPQKPKNLEWSYKYDGHAHAGSGHIWSQGLCLAYQLGGDTRAYDAMRLMGDHIAFAFAPGFNDMTPYLRVGGWALEAMCYIYEATLDPAYRRGADLIAAQIFKEQDHKYGAWPRMVARIYRKNRNKPKAYYTGNTAFMTGLLIGSIANYHRVTDSPRAAKSLALAASWLKKGFTRRDYAWWYDIDPYGKPLNSGDRGPFTAVGLNCLSGMPVMYAANISGDSELKDCAFDAMRGLMLVGLSGSNAKNFAVATYGMFNYFEEMNKWSSAKGEPFVYDESKMLNDMLSRRRTVFNLRFPEQREFKITLLKDSADIKVEHYHHNGAAGKNVARSFRIVDAENKVIHTDTIIPKRNYFRTYRVNGKKGDVFRVQISENRQGIWNVKTTGEYIVSVVIGDEMIGINSGAVSRFYVQIPKGTKSFQIRHAGFNSGNNHVRIYNGAGKLIGGEDSGDKGGKYHNYTNEAPEKVNYWSIVTWGGACQSFCFKGIPGEIFIRHPEKL